MFFFFYLTAKTAYRHYDGLITIADFFHIFFFKKKTVHNDKRFTICTKKKNIDKRGHTVCGYRIWIWMEDFSLLQSHTVLWICWRANKKKKDIKIGKYELQRRPPPCMV
jgi:hypothetical protein